LILLGATRGSTQSQRGPSTLEEREKALADIDDLEKNPLGPDAIGERRWLTIWLIEVPDIHVGFCTDLIPGRPKGEKNDIALISTQMMFSGARYAIKHPETTSNDIAQYEAGVEGMLRMYEVLVQQKPADRLRGLDELLQKRADGTLSDYVKSQFAAHCKK
jgi:hypothetical protein